MLDGLVVFFPHKGLFFLKPWRNNFPSWKFNFSTSHADPPIVGASDIGNRHYGPKARQSGPGIEPRTDKKITLHGKGIEPQGPANHIWNIGHTQTTKITSLHMEHNWPTMGNTIEISMWNTVAIPLTHSTWNVDSERMTARPSDFFDLGKKI
jgi:hypothetical protein